MTAIPASWAAPGPFSTAGFPSTTSSPLSGWYTPARIFTSVDLPAPFSPTSPCASPPYRSIDPSTIACTAPNDFAAPRSDSSGVPPPRPLACAADAGAGVRPSAGDGPASDGPAADGPAADGADAASPAGDCPPVGRVAAVSPAAG